MSIKYGAVVFVNVFNIANYSWDPAPSLSVIDAATERRRLFEMASTKCNIHGGGSYVYLYVCVCVRNGLEAKWGIIKHSHIIESSRW